MAKDRTIERAGRLLDRLARRRQDAVQGWHLAGPDFWSDRGWWANVRLAIAAGAGRRP